MAKRRKRPAARSAAPVREPVRSDARAKNGRRHKRRRKKNRVLVLAIVALFMVVSVVVLSLTVLFHIETIEVAGGSRYAAEEIIAASGIETGDNLFMFSSSKVKQQIFDAFAYAEQIEVNRKIPAAVVIEVKDAVPSCAIADGTGYTLISRLGKVLETKGANVPEGVPVVKGIVAGEFSAGNYVDPQNNERYKTLQGVTDALANNGYETVKSIDMADPLNIKIEYTDLVTINLGSVAQASYKLQLAKAVIDGKLDEGKAYDLDASVEGKTVVKQRQ